MKRTPFILFTIAFLLYLNVNAQEVKDIALVKNIFNTNEQIAKLNTGTTKNPVQYLFTGLFVFYKKCISSQDYPSCNFTPSCSEYALKVIKKKGLVIGLFAAFDRLSRCNHPYADGYEIDINTHKLKDDL